MREEDMTSLIRELTCAEEAVRQDAAAAIFRGGSDLVAPIVQRWLTDPELARLFLASNGTPKVTVGLAVRPAHFDQIRAANGSPRLADVPPDQDAKEFELDLDGGVHLDILTSLDPRGVGAIARYLAKFGEGIQQVELEVSDIDRATELLRARFGVEPIYAATRPGANGTRVNFFLARDATGGKVLVELVQDDRCWLASRALD